MLVASDHRLQVPNDAVVVLVRLYQNPIFGESKDEKQSLLLMTANAKAVRRFRSHRDEFPLPFNVHIVVRFLSLHGVRCSVFGVRCNAVLMPFGLFLRPMERYWYHLACSSV